MTTPKDIEAAKEIARLMEEEGDIEIVDDENREPVSSHISVNTATKIDEDGISRIAQALAAAREEGRRSMLDECLLDLDHHMEQLEGPNSYWGKQALHDLRLEIEGIPTNAPEPEGESDE